MNVYLYQNSKQHGPYPLDQLKAWLLSGQVSPTVMAQREGETGWIPLCCIPQLRDDQSLEMVIKTATSGDFEIESKIVQQTLQEIEELLATSGDLASRANIQNRLQWKLRIYSKQVYAFKAQFPDTVEARAYEASIYSAQARARATTIGSMRKSEMRSSNVAWGVVSGILANQQEKNNALQAIPLFDQALSIFDNPSDRFAKALIHYELKQSQEALRELNHIITNFQDDPLYVSARQFKDEIETP
jgi:tetratricopeptide (TPR) repeat protein